MVRRATSAVPDGASRQRQMTGQMTSPEALTPDAWNGVRSRLSGYVRRRVDPASADDVIGQILLRLVHHQETLRAADNPAAWMLRVAANAVADHHRRRAVERRALDAFGAEEGGGAAPAEEPDSTVAEEFAACLIPFIRELPPTYGEALMLTDIGGLSQAEAARRLGLSASGLKSRVQRGRAKLRQALLRCCAIETDRWGTVLDYRSRNRPPKCSGEC